MNKGSLETDRCSCIQPNSGAKKIRRISVSKRSSTAGAVATMIDRFPRHARGQQSDQQQVHDDQHDVEHTGRVVNPARNKRRQSECSRVSRWEHARWHTTMERERFVRSKAVPREVEPGRRESVRTQVLRSAQVNLAVALKLGRVRVRPLDHPHRGPYRQEHRRQQDDPGRASGSIVVPSRGRTSIASIPRLVRAVTARNDGGVRDHLAGIGHEAILPRGRTRALWRLGSRHFLSFCSAKAAILRVSPRCGRRRGGKGDHYDAGSSWIESRGEARCIP